VQDRIEISHVDLVEAKPLTNGPSHLQRLARIRQTTLDRSIQLPPPRHASDDHIVQNVENRDQSHGEPSTLGVEK
jgi:hypothetical protein